MDALSVLLAAAAQDMDAGSEPHAAAAVTVAAAPGGSRSPSDRASPPRLPPAAAAVGAAPCEAPRLDFSLLARIVALTPAWEEYLASLFAETPFPPLETIDTAAASLGVSSHSLSLWFAEMRSKNGLTDDRSIKSPPAPPHHFADSQAQPASRPHQLPPISSFLNPQHYAQPPQPQYATPAPAFHSQYQPYPPSSQEDRYAPRPHSPALPPGVHMHPQYSAGSAAAAGLPSLSPTSVADGQSDGGVRGKHTPARRDVRAGSAAAAVDPAASGSKSADYKKNKRFIMSREHLKWLKSVFEETQFPSAERMQEISEVVGMDKRQVRVWFQNRRAVEKRKIA